MSKKPFIGPAPLRDIVTRYRPLSTCTTRKGSVKPPVPCIRRLPGIVDSGSFLRSKPTRILQFSGSSVRRMRGGLFLSDRADARGTRRIYRQGHHVFLKRNPGGGIPARPASRSDDQSGRYHTHRFSRTACRASRLPVLPLQSRRYIPAGERHHGSAGRGKVRLHQGAIDIRL